MTVLGSGLDISNFTALQNMAAYTFCQIKNGGVTLPDARAFCDGITLEQYNQGQTVLIRYVGQAKVVCGEEIKDGSFLTTDQNGKAVIAKEGDVILAKAFEAGAQDQIIRIELVKMPQVKQQDFKQTLKDSISDQTVVDALKKALGLQPATKKE